jgi:ABC-type nitrate/sulfonate/bicarbonate transport system substrate-binding protein
MDVNNMIAALAAKTVDVMVNVEPYNAIAEADGIANTIVDFSKVDPLPVFMAATPEFVQKSPDTIVAYLRAWLDAAKDFTNSPDKIADVIYTFYTSKGYKMDRTTFRKAMATVEVAPGFPTDLGPYMQGHAEVLLKEKKISKIPDWKVALRTEFMEKARAGS